MLPVSCGSYRTHVHLTDVCQMLLGSLVLGRQLRRCTSALIVLATLAVVKWYPFAWVTNTGHEDTKLQVACLPASHVVRCLQTRASYHISIPQLLVSRISG